MEVTCSTETSVGFQWTTGRNFPEERTVYKGSVVMWSPILKVLISVMGFCADFSVSTTETKCMCVHNCIHVTVFTYMSVPLLAGKVPFGCCFVGWRLWTARYVCTFVLSPLRASVILIMRKTWLCHSTCEWVYVSSLILLQHIGFPWSNAKIYHNWKLIQRHSSFNPLSSALQAWHHMRWELVWWHLRNISCSC